MSRNAVKESVEHLGVHVSITQQLKLSYLLSQVSVPGNQPFVSTR